MLSRKRANKTIVWNYLSENISRFKIEYYWNVIYIAEYFI